MKTFFLCLALSALSALGGTRDGSGAPLRIYTDFHRDPPIEVYRSLQRELHSLVAPIRLQLDWRTLASQDEPVVSAALVVVTFKGRCDVQSLESHRIESGALAWTHISDEQILPFVDVDCDHLREFLQYKLLRVEAKLRETLFGRALARVLGHELFHVFAGTRHHTKEGVAQTALTSSDLLAPEFGFAEKELRILRSTGLQPLLGLETRNVIDYKSTGCGACHGPAAAGTKLAPRLHGDVKSLTAGFEKRSEDMYRRARGLNLEWQFPNERELRNIVAALSVGME